MFVKPGEDIVQHHTPMVIMLEGDGPLEALVEKAAVGPPLKEKRARRTQKELRMVPAPRCPKGHQDVMPRINAYPQEEWYCNACLKGFNEPGVEILFGPATDSAPMGARPRRTSDELRQLPTRPACPKGHKGVTPRIMEYDKEEWYCNECRKGFNEPGVEILAMPERVRRSYGELNSIHFTKRPSCPELHGPHRIEPRSDSDFFHEWYCCECSKDYHKRTGSYYEGFNEPGVKLIHPDEAKRRGIS